MIQNHLRKFLTDVVTKWNAGQKMTLFMVLMSFEVSNYLLWMMYIKYSSYAQQFVNVDVINTMIPWAVIAVISILGCAYLFYRYQQRIRFIHSFQLVVMVVYTLGAAYVGYLVGQDNIMSATAISTAGLLIVLFCERKFSYWIVGLNLACLFGVMYASNTGIFPPPEFYLGTQKSEFWVFTYMLLCGLKVMIILLIADNMLFALKQSYRESKFLSEHDALTGLPNRLNTQAYLLENIKTHHHVGLIMIDLDNFKQINDHFGHLFGDEVLIHTSKLMTKHLRKHDVLGRYGGEEFVLVLPETTMSESINVAEELHDVLNTLNIPIDKNSVLQPKASFGVVATDFMMHYMPKQSAQFSSDEVLRHLFELADMSMYFAKQSGRNQVVSADKLPTDFLDNAQKHLIKKHSEHSQLNIVHS